MIEILQLEIGDTEEVMIGFLAGEAEENLPAIDGRNRSLRLSRGLLGPLTNLRLRPYVSRGPDKLQ